MKKLIIIISLFCGINSCSNSEQTEEEPQELTGTQKILVKSDFEIAVINYNFFIDPITTPGEGGPERWEILRDFRKIKDEYPNSEYSDSAKMYIDSLDLRFDSGELRPQ